MSLTDLAEDKPSSNVSNVWIGSRTGLLKSVDLIKKVATNHYEDKNYGKENEITCMCWKSPDKSGMLTAHQNGIVRTFQTVSGNFRSDLSTRAPNVAEGERGTLCSIRTTDDERIITASNKGNFCVWKHNDVTAGDDTITVQTGDNLSCLDCNRGDNLVACGGKENPLKIYDLNNLDAGPVFKSKNVKHDWLQLRVPIWVTGVQFIPQTSKVLTVTGTHNIRVYDPHSNAKRPVLETRFSEYPIVSSTMVERKPHQVVVANTHGDCAAFDIRKMKQIVKSYKGSKGSIRGLVSHEKLPYLLSCGLDRHLYVHHEGESKPRQKVYLKSQLNCLLASDLPIEETPEEESDRKRKVEDEASGEKDVWDELDENANLSSESDTDDDDDTDSKKAKLS